MPYLQYWHPEQSPTHGYPLPVIAVVTHREIMPRRYFADKAITVIAALVAVREARDIRDERQAHRYRSGCCTSRRSVFPELLGVVHPVRIVKNQSACGAQARR